jgi:hypothetical protein
LVTGRELESSGERKTVYETGITKVSLNQQKKKEQSTRNLLTPENFPDLLRDTNHRCRKLSGHKSRVNIYKPKLNLRLSQKINHNGLLAYI